VQWAPERLEGRQRLLGGGGLARGGRHGRRAALL
jgi:hypothetical protein